MVTNLSFYNAGSLTSHYRQFFIIDTKLFEKKIMFLFLFHPLNICIQKISVRTN